MTSAAPRHFTTQRDAVLVRRWGSACAVAAPRAWRSQMSQSNQYAHMRGFIRTNWYSSRSSSAGLRSSRTRASSTTDKRWSNSSLESWPLANARWRSPAASSLPRSPTRRRPLTDNGLPGGGSTSSTASEHRSRDDLRKSDPGRCRLRNVALEGRMHHHIPILGPESPKAALSNAPSIGKADNCVVVIAPQARRDPVGAPVPGVHRRAHGRMIWVLEGHEDVRIVVARCSESRRQDFRTSAGDLPWIARCGTPVRSRPRSPR